MNWIAPILAIAVTACGSSPAAAPNEPQGPKLGAGDDSSRVIKCTRAGDGAKVRAHFGDGSSLRELVVWYTAVTCRTVIVSAELLERTSRNSIDAMVSADKVDDLFHSRLQELGVRAAHSRDDVVVLGDRYEAAVFTGVQ